MKKQILIATRNQGKIKEIREFLNEEFEILGLDDFEIKHEVEETGTTFKENAIKKAKEYGEIANIMTISPAVYNGATDIQAQYIRYPKSPNWTYINVSDGSPAFNQSAADFQDFELSPDDETSLVFKILQYAGMSIREIQAAQFGAEQEQMEEQKEN